MTTETYNATYTLSFDREADGGPGYVLWLLKEHVLVFHLIGGEPLTARVIDVDIDQNEVVVTPFIDGAESYSATELEEPKTIRLTIGRDFNKVTYC